MAFSNSRRWGRGRLETLSNLIEQDRHALIDGLTVAAKGDVMSTERTQPHVTRTQPTMK
jgi:hypothetical protein